MSTGCNCKPIVFQGHGRRVVTASCDGWRHSSDGGALLLREAGNVFGVTGPGDRVDYMSRIARNARRPRVVSKTKSQFTAAAFPD